MTREEAKKLLPIIQAFADGKKIEYSNNGEIWIETETPRWDIDVAFRIKLEPKYRPFVTKEECWEEMHKHPDFGWIIYNRKYHNICGVTPDEITILYEGDPCCLNFKSCIGQVTFTDGAPFGIKEE